MSVLKNSSGKLLLNGGKPIQIPNMKLFNIHFTSAFTTYLTTLVTGDPFLASIYGSASAHAMLYKVPPNTSGGCVAQLETFATAFSSFTGKIYGTSALYTNSSGTISAAVSELKLFDSKGTGTVRGICIDPNGNAYLCSSGSIFSAGDYILAVFA